MQDDLREYVKKQVLELFPEISGSECCMPAELLPIECDKIGARINDQSPLGTERLDKIYEGKVYTIEMPPSPPPPTSKKERPPELKYLGSWNKTRRPHDIGRQHKRNKAAKKSRKINRK